MKDIEPLLREAGTRLMLPRWRQLSSGDVEEKSPGEVVTAVDRDVEHFLAGALRHLTPSAVVIGEEACSAEPALLQRVDADDAWLIDPLDGTRNFIEGSDNFGILLARMRRGECVASWIYQPVTAVLFAAERGGGAWKGNERLATQPRAARRGVVETRFIPPGPVRDRVQQGLQSIDTMRGCKSTAVDYPRVSAGALDFVLYWRTLPWDHAGPALFLQEAGGVVRRVDGSDYRPGDGRESLLVAADEGTWSAARQALFG